MAWCPANLLGTTPPSLRLNGNHRNPCPPQMYPPELTVAGPNLRFDYEPSVVRDLLERLVPSNMLLVVSAQDFKGKTDKVGGGHLSFVRSSGRFPSNVGGNGGWEATERSEIE